MCVQENYNSSEFFAGTEQIPNLGVPRARRGLGDSRNGDTDKLIVGGARGFKPELGQRFHSAFGVEKANNGNLVASLELGTAEAIFPRFQRESAAFYHMETDFTEEIHNIREGKYRVEFVDDGFFNERLDQHAADALGLGFLIHRQGSDFSDGGGIEVQGTTPEQRFALPDHAEIANGFGEFKL